jgi:hypothetical protein
MCASELQGPHDLSAIAEKLKRRSKNDFKGRHFEASLILQAVSWYLRYPLSYRDIEELFLERGLDGASLSLCHQGISIAGLSVRRALKRSHVIWLDFGCLKARRMLRCCHVYRSRSQSRLTPGHPVA